MISTQYLIKQHKIFAIVLIMLILVFIINGQYLRVLAHSAFKNIISKYLALQTKDFKVLEGENFIVKYTDKDANSADLILKTAEEYLILVQSKLKYSVANDKKILLVVYPDAAALNKSFGWAGDKSAVGVYWAGSIRLLSPRDWLNGYEMKLAEAFRQNGPLSHELVHLLIDQQTKGNYTRWLTEGIAQYIEEEITGFTLQEPSQQDMKVFYSFEELDKKFDALPNEALAYWQSLEFIRYLVRLHGIDKIHEVLTELESGDSVKTAFFKIYGVSLQELEENFRKSIIKQ